MLGLERRVLRALGEEVCERGLQVPQRLLHGHAADFVQPCVLGRFLQRRQRSGGLVIAHPFLALKPRIRAQTQHVVVDESGATKRARQHHLLIWRRIAAKAVGALDFHGSNNTIVVCKHNPAACGHTPFLLPLKGEVSRRFG